jgi:hypothetical protein
MQDSVVRSIDGTSVAPTPNVSSPTPQAGVAMDTKQAFMIWAVVAVVGVGVGFGLAKMVNSSGGDNPAAAPGAKTTSTTAGIKDTKRFPDKAEGKLVEGGIDGEGSFHLERAGGKSQNVYLTSSIVDLSEYVGKKVRVWGETFAAQKAGWLMDVGYVEKL